MMLEELIDYYENENKEIMETLNWDESLTEDIKRNKEIIKCLKEAIVEIEADVW